MVMRISSRLMSIADLVIAGEPVADIGSDHALLACYLVDEGRCPRAICGELEKDRIAGPLRPFVSMVWTI